MYYHAGFEIDGNVRWSNHTRLSWEAAVKEARKMAANGGRPLVEWWERSHGMRPGYECASGAEYIDRNAIRNA